MSNKKSELETIQLLKQENKALKSINRKASKKGLRLVGGFYEKDNKVYQFKAGVHLFRLPRIVEMLGSKDKAKEIVDPIGRVKSAEALKIPKIMDHLIDIGFAGIEVVED